MVEYTASLDQVFRSLSDPTRRDILRRVLHKELTISEVAGPYKMSFAAISKHLMVLEKAKLIMKKRRGKEQVVSVVPSSLKVADNYLEEYRQFWESKLDKLTALLESENKSH